MKCDPIIRASEYREGSTRYRITVNAGLHMIKGNSAPYFSLTGVIDEVRAGRWHDYSSGCIHEDILKLWPDLGDLAALHMSNIDGQPMHAEANGWYWLAGALGGLGERYHAGNAGQPKTPEECLRVFAEHCRITLDAARALAAELLDGIEAELSFKRRDRIRARWVEACKGMAPRWKAEADACIGKHKLVVFGDAWPVVS